ncbi:copper homeostasis protein CutC [Chryseobacterium koreense]|uniref:PF03932 family protein CutC n=1 Tax=Chryseobacterium koreense CCUG 49689 TaxID=1304281 RepID=A0A0J7IWY3_9FLAO|nr:copper homeostasis protein CutC [Chryseobacterium koreense]KMQ70798.1 copper homeostasis protein [Chryseobacterium koreense CCUG 49689]MBB5333646.1 copper homeostasis protein [Chryseobacterium koreense]
MLEIACFEMTSAETALKSVADRIEFCADQQLGGTTPYIEEFRYLKSVYRKPIFVMIRPKGGEFLYSDMEFEQMKKDIVEFKKAGADGFVFGILTAGNNIDTERNRQLVELAGEIPCTFHRAFDRTPDLDVAIKKLIRIGFRTVLTSGGAENAMKGKEKLRALIEQYSHQINILIGGGVRSGNIHELKSFTGGSYFHSSAIPSYETFADDDEIKKLKNAL